MNQILSTIIYALHDFTGSYALAMILFTLLLKLVISPLDYRSRKSMRRMQALGPEVQKLQKRYAKDQNKFAQKQMELYKKNNVSMFGGCLPMLLPLPILFILISVLYDIASEQTIQVLQTLQETGELHTQGFLWIKNIWQPDSFMSGLLPLADSNVLRVVGGSSIATEEAVAAIRAFMETPEYAEYLVKYGANITMNIPVLFWNITLPAQPNGYVVLPVLAAGVQYFQTFLTQRDQPQQPAQAQGGAGGSMKMMLYIMPLFSLWIGLSYNALVTLYWVCSGLFTALISQGIKMYFKYQDEKNPETFQTVD